MRTVRVPMREPRRTAGGVISESPLVLTDVITDAGVIGRSIVFMYTAAVLKPTADLTRNIGALVEPDPSEPQRVERRDGRNGWLYRRRYRVESGSRKRASRFDGGSYALGRDRKRMKIVLTLTGPDRIGIVEDVTRLLLEQGGNVETSRMARLGGEFAILMMVSLPAEQLAGLERSIGILAARGYRVTFNPTDRSYAENFSGWLSYRIEVSGADHEGIIHEIAHFLSWRGINIESMDTGTMQAPNSGMPLFAMIASVAVPQGLDGQDWKGELEDAGRRLNVEIKVSAGKKEGTMAGGDYPPGRTVGGSWLGWRAPG